MTSESYREKGTVSLASPGFKPKPFAALIMQEAGEIVLIGNESDILHSGYSHAISEGGKRYPSVNHYAHSQILLSLGIKESKLLDLLAVSTRDVPNKARDLLLDNMPSGHDLNSLSSYLSTSRHSYTMQGLRIRVHQDKAFERCLMETSQCLLIVCDSKDKELGIGMEEQTFAEWISRERVDAEQISYWMMNDIGRPQNLGANQLGYFLMWLRHEIKDGKKGVFRPLSNYFAMRFEIKGDVYRSVEHYAYEKLFISLKLDDKCIEKLNTTVNPIHIPLVAQRVFESQKIPQSAIDGKLTKLDRWRQQGMKHKLGNNDYLKQLLLSSGHALLVDFAEGDPAWTCGSSEAELQRLLAKDYVDAKKLMGWMKEKEDKVPSAVRHICGNKTGILLMELRERMANSDNQSRIPLISHLDLSTLSSQVSSHVICFTAESVWHPLYPAEITAPGGRILPSPAHFVAEKAIKFFSMKKLDAEYIMEDKSSRVCWQRLHEVLRTCSPDLEKDTQWWMVQRHAVIKEALLLMLEQHPPLLRALLDTHDALIVYCSRFSSMEAELSIGMRESDLRAWLQHVELETKNLMELCNRPLAFRPPYLGGNRLGFILMELRREFVLRGVFPSTLPDLGIDPCLMLAKDTGDKELLAAAVRTKAPPRMVSLDEERITAIVDDIDAMGGNVRFSLCSLLLDASYLSECAPEELRGAMNRLLQRLRGWMLRADLQQAEMNYVTREVTTQMQFSRRGLEEALAHAKQKTMMREGGGMMIQERMDIPPPGMPPIMPQSLLNLPMRRERSPQPPMSGGRGGDGGRRAMAGGERDEFRSGGRYDNGRSMQQGGGGGPQSGRRRSPERKLRGDLIPNPPRGGPPNNNHRGGSNLTPSRRPYRADERDRSPQAKRRRSPSPAAVVEPPKPAPPKVKAPRPADEELSDGEIIDSDED
ncbi:hypothetical protein PRIPAC_94619 [Pristionchus pacificus]|uniref:Uncharacterized protein n=1 Tax=Pristionchus pacificus TaxID=54126 RepID=A0A2A6CHZ5_PRIPA|nr:hypothetical protein PRIPAC_94619 [Pristionchus pacificus]|eukprot:PDM77641.1 hypothetical protein PRIPAC_34508 [Pristionchus pacificus]